MGSFSLPFDCHPERSEGPVVVLAVAFAFARAFALAFALPFAFALALAFAFALAFALALVFLQHPKSNRRSFAPLRMTVVVGG